jgi:hypothetical protein
MFRFVSVIYFVLVWMSVSAQTANTLLEKLGYDKSAKLLIIHADDLGSSQSENAASFYAMENGSVNSGSIMVPCPWFEQVVEYAKAHPRADLGIHLTMNSEWQLYKWGPVSDPGAVISLLDKNHYFPDNLDHVAAQAKIEEVEKELRAQIQTALDRGIDLTHLDTHMGAMALRPDLMSLYMKLGRDFKLPVMISKQEWSDFSKTDKDLSENIPVVLDNIYVAAPDDYKNGMTSYYTKILQNIKPGVHTVLMHTGYDNDEMRAITTGHEAYGAKWRQQDFDFFSSDLCKKLLSENKIQLITWREIKEKFQY